MGKASKWFKAFLGFKKNDSSSYNNKKKWSDVKSYKDKDFHQHHYHQHHDELHYTKSRDGVDPTVDEVHSITTTWSDEERAAVVIQSHFRAYLVSRMYSFSISFYVKVLAGLRGKKNNLRILDCVSGDQTLQKCIKGEKMFFFFLWVFLQLSI